MTDQNTSQAVAAPPPLTRKLPPGRAGYRSWVMMLNQEGARRLQSTVCNPDNALFVYLDYVDGPGLDAEEIYENFRASYLGSFDSQDSAARVANRNARPTLSDALTSQDQTSAPASASVVSWRLEPGGYAIVHAYGRYYLFQHCWPSLTHS
ncbi:MAG: hypothetical protein FWD74_00675 [Actinomycetia bacterium]|nr:hypothetical protein [Actinomycetes bacterium]